MIKSRLNINGTDIGFETEIPISTNFSIADVRDPDKRQATYTKTLKIPGTKEVTRLFEFVFEMNVTLQTFNPNLKTPAAYYTNEVLQFSGNLQLLSITEKKIEGVRSLIYNCTIIGTNADLFLSLQGKYLTDLDLTDTTPGGKSVRSDGVTTFSNLNHALTYANFSAVPVPGNGYCYGYIDYGVGATGVCDYNWDVEAMKAAVFEKEYVDRIFAVAGFTYTSTFLNSAYYKRVATPDVNEGKYQYSATQIINNQFYAGKTTTTGVAPVSAGIAGANYFYPSTVGINPVIFNDDSSAPFNDPGGLYGTGSGQYTTTNAGTHIVVFSMNYSIVLSAIATANSFAGNFNVSIDIYRNGVSVGAQQIQTYISTPNVSGGNATITANISTQYTIPAGLGPDPVGTIYQCVFIGANSSGQWFTGLNGSGSSISSGAASNLTFSTTPGSTFYSNLADLNQSFGNTIDMNNSIPRDVRQIDFLKSIILAHNLYLEQDKNNPTNYIIEPRDQFLITNIGSVQDWTYKQDLSQDLEILPMGALDARSYLFSYKEDKDYWNTTYTNKFKQIYGQKLVNVNNDFIRQDKVISLVFSPTPPVRFNNDILAPRFLQVEGGSPGSGAPYTLKPMKCNIRRLYWSGMKSSYQHNLRTSAASTPLITNSYPFLNSIDDAYNPTLDLNFGEVYETYYQLPSQTLTTNNLYNAYWKKFTAEITDPNSKILKTYILLNENDIHSFSFRPLRQIESVYYWVNSISDYDPQVRKPVLCELLKLRTGPTFVAVNYPPSNPPGGTNLTVTTSPGVYPSGNFGNSTNAALGSRVRNGGLNGLLIGVDSQIENSVVNFTAIGAKNYHADYTKNDMVSLSNDAVLTSVRGVGTFKRDRDTIIVTTHLTPAKTVYLVDASAGSLTIVLPDETGENCEYTIVRIDSTGNTVTVTGNNGTELINTLGVSAVSDAIPGFTTRRYYTDHTSWFY